MKKLTTQTNMEFENMFSYLGSLALKNPPRSTAVTLETTSVFTTFTLSAPTSVTAVRLALSFVLIEQLILKIEFYRFKTASIKQPKARQTVKVLT